VVRRDIAFRGVGRSRRVCRHRGLRGRHRRRIHGIEEGRTRAGGIVSEVWEQDAWELADAVRGGERRSTDLLDVFVERIEKLNPELNAFCYLDLEGARARAAAIDAAVARRSEEHTSELQSRENLVCRLLLEKKKIMNDHKDTK